MFKKIVFLLCIVYVSLEAKPRVSIITSVFKGDQFIEGFLRNITEQTIFEQCELLLINANSPGNEEPVIRKYMERYPNIIYIKLKRDPGLYGVWNKGIRFSLADFITNANLDDRRSRDSLELQAQALEAHPEVDLVYANIAMTYHVNDTFENHHAVGICNAADFSLKNMKCCMPGPAPMWRKSMHDVAGVFDEWFKSAGDYELWCRAASRGCKFLKIPGVLCLYYNNPNGLSTDPTGKTNKLNDTETALIHKNYGHLWQEAQG